MSKNINRVHIIGIGGCASSAIAEYLSSNGVAVSGSEMKKREDLDYLKEKGIEIFFGHSADNIKNTDLPDAVLFSPAVMALNPDNPELTAARENGIPLYSWEEFIGEYLSAKGISGITVSGSEGKGTTAGILTMILKDTKFDPLSILGAKIKKIGGADTNVYMGKGGSYILEGDEYNRNFHHYHPDINVMINFEYEHPETYKDFTAYKESFKTFFDGMKGVKTLILRATKNIIDFVEEYEIYKTHKIIFFGDDQFDTGRIKYTKEFYVTQNPEIKPHGVSFDLIKLTADKKTLIGNFSIPTLPGYIVNNAAGAVIAALELGLSADVIKTNIANFTGMVRRFDVFKTAKSGVFITDYGHSPESLSHICREIRQIYKDKKLHFVFQPHLFSRTFNFYKGFIEALSGADKVSMIDIYPARERAADWDGKVSSSDMAHDLGENGINSAYCGAAAQICENLKPRIDESEVTCFIGAGDMDRYYGKLFSDFGAVPFF